MRIAIEQSALPFRGRDRGCGRGRDLGLLHRADRGGERGCGSGVGLDPCRSLGNLVLAEDMKAQLLFGRRQVMVCECYGCRSVAWRRSPLEVQALPIWLGYECGMAGCSSLPIVVGSLQTRRSRQVYLYLRHCLTM